MNFHIAAEKVKTQRTLTLDKKVCEIDFLKVAFGVVFSPIQVLQQECVDVESLDDVDSSGKTLLDRLTVPVVFPDGYAHTNQFLLVVYMNIYRELGVQCLTTSWPQILVDTLLVPTLSYRQETHTHLIKVRLGSINV